MTKKEEDWVNAVIVTLMARPSPSPEHAFDTSDTETAQKLIVARQALKDIAEGCEGSWAERVARLGLKYS